MSTAEKLCSDQHTGATNLASDSDEEDDNHLFGIAMHDDIELSDTPHNVDTDHDFSHLDTIHIKTILIPAFLRYSHHNTTKPRPN